MHRHTTVFVKLLDEGVEVWRPAPAIDLGNGRYELVATEDYDPDLETWEFLPGTTVICERQVKSGGQIAVATQVVSASG